MESLYIEATETTPRVFFNYNTGNFLLEGKSVPENPKKFYTHILKLMDCYLKNPQKLTKINIKLDYHNVESSKQLLYLLYQLDKLVETGNKVVLNWFYSENEGNMYEVGQDFASMVSFPFSFIEYKPIDELLTV